MAKRNRLKAKGGNAHNRAIAKGKSPIVRHQEVPPTAAILETPKISTPESTPWYESTLLWGAFGVVITLVSVYLGFALRDIRWFLVAAFPFCGLVFFSLAKTVRIKRHKRACRLALIFWGSGLSGFALWKVAMTFPPPQNQDLSLQMTNVLNTWFSGHQSQSPPQASTPESQIPPEKEVHQPGPFSAAIESAVFTPASNGTIPFWITYPGVGGTVVSPLSVVAKLRIVNLQSQAVQISRLTIEASSSAGWAHLARIESQGVRLFLVGPPLGLKSALELRPVMLDAMLSDRAIGPDETVSGWVLLVYPRTDPSVSFAGKYRVTIADTIGQVSVIDTSRVDSGDFRGGMLPSVPGAQDLSSYREVLIQDLPGYWQNN